MRVALDGVNCTLGGSLAALGRHIDSVKADTILQGGDIDFKLSASRGARNSQVSMAVFFSLFSSEDGAWGDASLPCTRSYRTSAAVSTSPGPLSLPS